MRAEGQGKPITIVLTPGQQHEITQAEQLLRQGAIRRPRCKPRLRPKRLVGDKGYSYPFYRRSLRCKGIRVTIPRRKNQARCVPFDQESYRQRNRVKWLINRLKQFRWVATRYDKRASSYATLLTIAMCLLWLQMDLYTHPSRLVAHGNQH